MYKTGTTGITVVILCNNQTTYYFDTTLFTKVLLKECAENNIDGKRSNYLDIKSEILLYFIHFIIFH
jgi:hypothetical protein